MLSSHCYHYPSSPSPPSSPPSPLAFLTPHLTFSLHPVFLPPPPPPFSPPSFSSPPPTHVTIVTYDLKIPVDGLFFIGTQLVAISSTGKVAIWQSVQRHWQLQELAPIRSYDTAGSFLLLGCSNGSIYHIGKEGRACRLSSLYITSMPDRIQV